MARKPRSATAGRGRAGGARGARGGRGRGLTHRAVDRRAGLGEGSTSNYFPTREALLTATLRRLVELERPTVQALEEPRAGRPLRAASRGRAGRRAAAGLARPRAFGLTVARYELILEARRRPEFQLALNEVRREYRLLVERLLPAAGCRDPRRHAPHLLTVLDGLMVNQLFEPATALSEADMVDLLARFFASC